jgi:hypothetical protein
MDCDHENHHCLNPVRHPFAEEIIRCDDCNRWLERDEENTLHVVDKPYKAVTKEDLDRKGRTLFP